MSKLVEIKTKATEASVEDFLDSIEDEIKREDSRILVKMMQKASGEEARIWGTAMIGFGLKRYKSPATGREVDWFRIGFSPRKANISLHLVLNIQSHADLLEKLGKHKTGVGCLYFKKLSDIDMKVLEQLIQISLKQAD